MATRAVAGHGLCSCVGQWQDFDVHPGVEYYYWLETVALSGGTEMHGPASALFGAPTAVMLSEVLASPVAEVDVLSMAVTILALLLPLTALLAIRRRTA